MAQNENIVIKLMADTSNYTTKMQAASAQAEKLSTASQKPLSTTQKLEAGFTKAGLAVGALSVAVGVAAVKSFMDFDASMSVVQSNTHATGSELQSLRDAALDAGQRTVYSATESADAINELAKAGMSTADILNGGLNGALDLAASDGMAVSDAAELMASTLAQFNLTGKDSTKVADALAAGAGKAQGSASDLGMALSQAGLVANQYGISMQETTGTLAAFANAGMIGSDAGTSLKTMLLKLASPTDKAQSTLDELGISAYDAQGNFVGLSGLAGQLQEKMSGLSMEQRNAALQTIFGTDAIRGANVLYKEGSAGIDEWTSSVSDSGYAAEQGAARMDNLKGDIEQFGGAVETSLIKIGSGANGALRGVVQNVTGLVTAFGDLDPKIQQWVVMSGLAVGAAAALHKGLGGLSDSTSTFKKNAGLVLDPIQRIKTAAPQLSSGISQLSQAFGNAGRTAGSSSKAVGGLKTVGSGLVSLMGGPWGIAFTAASVALDVYAQHAAQSKAATSALSDSMSDGTNGVQKLVEMIKTGDNIDWGAWQKFETNGIASYSELLDKVGVSYTTAAKAASGNKAALDVYNVALENNNSVGIAHKAIVDEGTIKMGQLSKQYTSAKEAAKAEAEATKAETTEKVNNTLATAGLTTATEASTDSTEESADANDILADKLGASTKGINDQAAALGEAVSALKTYYGFAQSVFDADTKLGKAVNDANDAIKENGRTLDSNTEKGQANRDALSGVVSAVQDSAEAYARNGSSIDEVNSIMAKGREQVVKLAESFGMSSADAQAFADSVGLTKDGVNKLTTEINKTPEQKTTNITTTAPQAKKEVDDYIESCKAIPDSTSTNTTTTAQRAKMEVDVLTGGIKAIPGSHSTKVSTPGSSGSIGSVQTLNDKLGNVPLNTSANVVVNGIGSALSQLSQLQTALGMVRQTSVGTSVSLANITNKATGGYISGPGTATSDSIPARLSNGEYVIRASAVDHYGVGLFDQLNYQQYASGGLVQKYQTGIVPNKMDGGVSRSSQAPIINLTYVDQVAGLGGEARLTQAARRAKSILADVY